MKNKIKYVLMLVTTLCVSCHQDAALVGLWEIEKVLVGKKQMTPVAKWTRINADGSYQSGNGWLQSADGVWRYDEANSVFVATDSLDVEDEFGGFKLSFDNGNMYWEREEEGMPVKVTLVPIEKLPTAPADYLEGIWDLVEITKADVSILNDFDKANKHRLFIRWDRIYIDIDAQGQRNSGYWHIHGHRSELTLLPHEADKTPESWQIEVNTKELIMTGKSDTNQDIRRVYARRNAF